MALVNRNVVKYNAALGAGERGEIKAALLASTTMSESEIQTVFEQLDAYPDDRAMILKEINKVLNKRSINVVYVSGVKWQKETTELDGGNIQTVLDRFAQENAELRYRCSKYKSKYEDKCSESKKGAELKY